MEPRASSIVWNFYPRPPRGGRLKCPCKAVPIVIISIHALREEGDTVTLSVMSEVRDFYPRPPRGGRRHFPQLGGPPLAISIHALREEGDDPAAVKSNDNVRFLSTPSARRATTRSNEPLKKFDISIHALREEGDPGLFRNRTARCYFYPRPPRGGRPATEIIKKLCEEFLSTPSARRAT